jgi:enamine deaminase RidA (YjgF/YER057c/UK114 family)
VTVEHVNPDTLPEYPGFSQAVIAPAGRLAFIAGQGAFTADNRLVGPDDLHAQVVQAFQNLAAALTACGAGVGDVVSSVFYVVDLDDAKTATFVAAMNESLDGTPFPPNASSIVGVTRLGVPGMLVEISAVAAVP